MKWFYDLKMRTKLLAGFLFMVVIALAIGVVGFVNTTNISDAMNAMYQGEQLHSTRLQGLSTAFQRMHSEFLLVVLARTEEERMASAQKAEIRNEEVRKFAKEVEMGIRTEEEKTAFKTFSDAINVFSTQREEVVDLVTSSRLNKAKDLLYSNVETTRRLMHESLVKLVDINLESSRVAAEQSSTTAEQAKVAIVVVLGLGVLLGLLFGVFVARSVSQPIKAIVQSVENADLNTVFKSDRKDEIGDLMKSFDRFVETLKETLTRVIEAAAAVASASAEISAGTEEMAAGAQEQSSQAADVSSAMEQMTRTILENSKNAAGTTETAKSARVAAERGGKVVQESINAMRKIAEVVLKSASTVRALGKSSDQIGDIVSVIDDIADQTNLLALNAAIEAARAGEQGRGFAVVADEVRKLAERTSTATKEIAEMIKKIQTDTTDAVVSMEAGTKEVNEGIRLADDAGNALSEIVEVFHRVTEKVAQIAAASEQQAASSEQISKNVEAISSVTHETASGIQEIARTAEDLNRLTESLQTLMGRFKLSSDGTTQSSSEAFSNDDAGVAKNLGDPEFEDRTEEVVNRIRGNGKRIHAVLNDLS
jgi:methyl-accepting chemotaxis protein